MSGHVNYSGLVVAGIGFFLTRFTVTLVVTDDPLRFYLAGIAPLVLGLGLAAFGVALAVADLDAAVVRTTAIWCVVGFLTMLMLTVLTVLGSDPGGMAALQTFQSGTVYATFLIGGSVGGTLTGLYAASNRRQRGVLRQQTNRLYVINRMLRHEVLNAVTIIRGYATTDEPDLDSQSVIADRSSDIARTIEEVKHLTQRTSSVDASGRPIPLHRALQDGIETTHERYPEVEVSWDPVPDDLLVRGDEHLSQVFTHLLENAIVHGGDSAPDVGISVQRGRVKITVRDDGPGLPARQQRLLETGDIEEFDDPKTGFGLNLVRLLVEGYDGTIETQVEGSGSSITVVLPRVDRDRSGLWPKQADIADVRPAVPHLIVTLVAALIAGIPYGIVSELLGGSIAGIGVFYGASNPVIGWLTHEFHSVVFGFVYVSLITLLPEGYRQNFYAYLAVGLGWSIVLWSIAASLVGPVWLQLLGLPVPLPNFSVDILLSHLVWGVTLAILTSLGFEHVTPWLTDVLDRASR